MPLVHNLLKNNLSLTRLSVQSKMGVERPGMPGQPSSKISLWSVMMWLGPATDAPHVTFEISVAPDKIFLVADMVPRRYVTFNQVLTLNQVRNGETHCSLDGTPAGFPILVG
jgi:hypothetical protein